MSHFKTYWLLLALLIVARFLTYDWGAIPQSGGLGACNYCKRFRKSVTNRVYSYVPSPNAELLLGTTLGINLLHLTPRFNDVLIRTGTIHVVVVSGYNISLVIGRLINLFRNNNSFIKVFTAQIIALIYALITGFEAPIVRALLMASVVLWMRYYGKRGHTTIVLLVTAAFMLLFSPSYLVDLSFQLSFLATLGIVSLYPRIYPYLSNYLGKNVFVEDLTASLSAQLLVTPVLLYSLGRVSLISPLINAITLWLIPLLTVLGFIVIPFMYINVIGGPLSGMFYTVISSVFTHILNFNSVLVER